MLFLGFIVLLLIIGKIHGDNERAEQERQEQREYTTRKWQQAADEDELFRLEMGAKGCAWQARNRDHQTQDQYREDSSPGVFASVAARRLLTP